MHFKHRVVVVENSKSEMDRLKNAFKNTGIKLNHAGSAFGLYNAIEQYGKMADAILLNANLKTSDPIELIQELRHNQRYNTIPIVIVSETVDNQLIEKIKSLKINHLIKKPYDEIYLKELIRELISNKTD